MQLRQQLAETPPASLNYLANLICKFTVTIGNENYMVGDKLPSDHEFADLWIKNGTAKLESEVEEQVKKPKAKLVSEKGTDTEAIPKHKTDVINQVPAPEDRGVVKESTRRRSKKSE